jgi:glutaminyl-tRNA synthetase
MAVLRPLKLVIENYPAGKVEQIEAINNPEDESAGTRQLPFSRELYIEADDFREDAPKKWFRMAPGKLVRLKHAYIVKCERAVKDEAGNVVEVHCTYDPNTRGGEAQGVKVRGTLHWVSAAHALDAQVRLYDHLFAKENPSEDEDYLANLNPESLVVLDGCKVEPGLRSVEPGAQFQFLRQGYFCCDRESTPERLVYNRTVGLKDSWAKLEKKGG